VRQLVQRGFSLIELLIAMVIMSVLTMVAVPSYQNHIKKSRIAMAKADLMELAGYLERQRTINGCYNGPACNKTKTNGPDALIANQSSGILASLSKETAQYYDVTLEELTDSIFILRATPDSSTTQRDTGYLEILHTGQQRWDKNHDGDTNDAGEGNWKR